MTAADRFMKKISDYYNDLGYPVVWEDVGSERQLEIQFKSESGYFVTATLLAEGNDVIVKDEWGRAQKIKATKGNLEMIKSWSEERYSGNLLILLLPGLEIISKFVTFSFSKLNTQGSHHPISVFSICSGL